MDALLIVLADILVYRKIDRQINADNLNGHILTVQRNQLRDLLGDAFYFAVINDVVAFANLIDGETYQVGGNDVNYFGLKPFIVFHVLSGLLTDGSLKISDVGNVNMLDTTFQKASSSDLRIAKQEYTANATIYRNNIIDYLTEKGSSVYPLWVGHNKTEVIDLDFQII